MKRKIKVLILLVLIAVWMGTGCKKSGSGGTTVTTVDSGKIYLHLHTNVDTNEVENYGTLYTTSDGRKIKITVAEQYVSHIELISTDGSVCSVPATIILQQQATEQYFVGKAPVGNYKTVRFRIGLDSATNTLASTADSVLNHPEMWFGLSAQPNGYVYVNLQGSIDTTAHANGTEAQMQPFMFMIGTNAHYTQVTMPDHSSPFSVLKNGNTFVHITADYYKLFTGLPLSNSTNLLVMSASDNSTSRGNIIAGNIGSMFSYEE